MLQEPHMVISMQFPELGTWLEDGCHNSLRALNGIVWRAKRFQREWNHSIQTGIISCKKRFHAEWNHYTRKMIPYSKRLSQVWEGGRKRWWRVVRWLRCVQVVLWIEAQLKKTMSNLVLFEAAWALSFLQNQTKYVRASVHAHVRTNLNSKMKAKVQPIAERCARKACQLLRPQKSQGSVYCFSGFGCRGRERRQGANPRTVFEGRFFFLANVSEICNFQVWPTSHQKKWQISLTFVQTFREKVLRACRKGPIGAEGVPGVAGAKKTRKMLWCLAESSRNINRALWQGKPYAKQSGFASSTLVQDGKDGRLTVRFQFCLFVLLSGFTHKINDPTLSRIVFSKKNNPTLSGIIFAKTVPRWVGSFSQKK